MSILKELFFGCIIGAIIALVFEAVELKAHLIRNSKEISEIKLVLNQLEEVE
jgi:flagellar biosynthesis protein FliR